MNTVKPISLDDTAAAFVYKSDRELRLAHFLFSAMRFKWFVYLATRILPLLIRLRLPVRWLIRKTIFRQFVGGETLEETIGVKKRLAAHAVGVIMDYGLERMDREEDFEKTCREYIALIEYAAGHTEIPFISLKMTSLARFELLAQLNNTIDGSRRLRLPDPQENALKAEVLLQNKSFSPQQAPVQPDVTQQVRVPQQMHPAPASDLHSPQYTLSQSPLRDTYSQQEWSNVEKRLSAICETAAQKGVGVLIDAEESWIQHTIDFLALRMMQQFNRQRPVVFNTYQLYRTDILGLLKADHAAAGQDGFLLGAKLVRGAYLEKERRRAVQLGLQSPIHATKEATDADFNTAIRYCMENLATIVFIVASHNEYSNRYALRLMAESDLPAAHPSVHFSQLYGMSDNITFNLAAAGFSVTKYLPYGPLEKVIPYLMRRVQENSSIGGQTGRELGLLKKELKRRKQRRIR